MKTAIRTLHVPSFPGFLPHAGEESRRWLRIFLSALPTAILIVNGNAHADEPTPERRTELITLVRQDCGSCHGLTLKGGLGPPLLPETLADRPAESLTATILNGRPGTAMPPWRRFLNEAEADWIVRHLQKGFPSGH